MVVQETFHDVGMPVLYRIREWYSALLIRKIALTGITFRQKFDECQVACL
jgi:hypothetical protein